MNLAEIVLPDHPVSTAAWIQVHQRVITSALFLDFESCVFLGKPSTVPGLFFIISQNSDRLQQRKLRLKQIILDLNKEIAKLLQEAKSRNITKNRNEQINTDLMDIYEQISDKEQALVLLG